jgi:lipoate-protein ligase A
MGISGKPEELIHSEKTRGFGYPVIQRFSGGGTVIVDANTLFVSFICNKKDCASTAYPEQILRWTEQVFKESFSIQGFSLRENDFVINHLKCGGNAQYITKDRWVQHTSFLWDFCPKNMECLLHPKKTPTYREGRSHQEFLCTLKSLFPSKEAFFDSLISCLSKKYNAAHCKENIINSHLEEGARISSRYIDLP